jgi:hypothetical protein
MPFSCEQVKLLVIVIVFEEAPGQDVAMDEHPRRRTWPPVKPVLGVTVEKPKRAASGQNPAWATAEPEMARRVVARRAACMIVVLERGCVGACW